MARKEDLLKMARKPKYKSPEEMQAVIDQYFADCDGKPIIAEDGGVLRDKFGEIVYDNAKPPTITGLALALGFTTRHALLSYQGKKEFMHTVLRAKSRIEEYAERRLYDRDGQRGAEFSLKYNFKWAQEEKKDGAEDGATGVVMLPVILPAPEPPREDET